MRFFSQFPITDYKINGEATSSSLIDIYRHVDVNETLIDDITSYRLYNIKDGERPDIVSFKLYGSPEYHWSFFIINEELNSMNDWPRSFNEQASFIDKKYDEHSVLEFFPYQETLINAFPLESIPSRFTTFDLPNGNGAYSRIIDGTYGEPRWIISRIDGQRIIISIRKYDADDELSYAWTIKNITPGTINSDPFIRLPKGSLNDVFAQRFWEQTGWYNEITSTNVVEEPKFTFGKEILKYHNYFGNIDFSDPNVKIKVKGTNHEADVEAYDSERLQLWVKNISANSFLSNDELTYVLDYDSDAAVSERETWLNTNILPWLQEHHGDQYNNLINDERVISDNILPYTRGFLDTNSASNTSTTILGEVLNVGNGIIKLGTLDSNIQFSITSGGVGNIIGVDSSTSYNVSSTSGRVMDDSSNEMQVTIASMPEISGTYFATDSLLDYVPAAGPIDGMTKWIHPETGTTIVANNFIETRGYEYLLTTFFYPDEQPHNIIVGLGGVAPNFIDRPWKTIQNPNIGFGISVTAPIVNSITLGNGSGTYTVGEKVTQNISYDRSKYDAGGVDSTGIISGTNFFRGSITSFVNKSVTDLLYSDYLPNVEFKTKRTWLKSYNAPHNYLSDDGDDITTYDALKADADNDAYVTYFSAEEEENESKKNIRVLRDADVESFADYYKELINE
jgi:hypothetical protein